MTSEQLLRVATEHKASDLLLMSGQPPLLKVDGHWRPLENMPPMDDGRIVNLLIEVMPPHLHDHLKLNHDGSDPRPLDLDFSFATSDGTRYRANIYNTQGRPAAVIRIIPNRVIPLEKLGFPVNVVERALRSPQGLILVTGATGSGKSTTLAAMVEWINTHAARHIVTIEDPIEFVFVPKRSIISQREVGSDTESFLVGLRAALRQAPDVILVGEMRDQETIRAALTAAETGHLVMATLHTNSAPEAVTRIVDVFGGDEQHLVRTQLADTLLLVIRQALLPAASGGRVLAYELMVNTPAIANLIRKGDVHQIPGAMKTGREQGMVPYDLSVKTLAQKGLITRETANAALHDPREGRL